jgi:hypothetical protein
LEKPGADFGFLLLGSVFRFFAWGVGAALVLGAASAQADQAPVWVWYRTSAGCPSGDAFVARLSELGHSARLAKVGDRVDPRLRRRSL